MSGAYVGCLQAEAMTHNRKGVQVCAASSPGCVTAPAWLQFQLWRSRLDVHLSSVIRLVKRHFAPQQRHRC